MGGPLAKLLDKRQMALTRARLKAWWDGSDFDLQAFETANETGAEINLEEELFEAPAPEFPARFAALALLWGEGRIAPGDDAACALAPAQLGLETGGAVALLGAGLWTPVAALANAHAGKIAAFEWREETFPSFAHGVKRAKLGERVSVQRVDIETYAFEAEAFDGVWSLDEFTFADEPARFAHRLAKALKPDRCLMIEFYAGLPSPDIPSAFASSFSEPHVRAAGDVAHFLIESGLKIEAHDDVTDEHIELAKRGFKGLETSLKEAGGIDVAVARELAWEAESWRTRLKLLGDRRLERRRIIARRPAP
ncbi:MAG: class I SAM-dependent methyltransferase [Caulobacterales bacterium]